MSARLRNSKFLTLDAFTKTEEDVRIRTNAGGLITLGCIITTIVLLFGEWEQLFEIVTRPQLVVDRDRHLKLDLNFDITFPSVSCDILTLDIMDDSGDMQLHLLDSGFTKTRVDAEGRSLSTEPFQPGPDKQTREFSDDYCGSCYGALDQTENDNIEDPKERVCCQTCADVHDAYMEVGWRFDDGSSFEQCVNEGYVSRINDHLTEGCRVKGSAKLNRIQGNLHFAPGMAYELYKTSGAAHHFHDTSLYDRYPNLNFNHIIHHLSFGKPVDDIDSKRHNNEGLSKINISPLDGRAIFPDRDTHFHQYSYFAKIVPTRYEYLNRKTKPIETAQFSATFHSRPLRGGRDEDHPNTVHSTGGISGLFIYFEMSPLKVINREQHAQTWSGFLLNCIATIGCVLAVGQISDKLFYRAQQTILKKKTK